MKRVKWIVPTAYNQSLTKCTHTNFSINFVRFGGKMHRECAERTTTDACFRCLSTINRCAFECDSHKHTHTKKRATQKNDCAFQTSQFWDGFVVGSSVLEYLQAKCTCESIYVLRTKSIVWFCFSLAFCMHSSAINRWYLRKLKAVSRHSMKTYTVCHRLHFFFHCVLLNARKR